MQLDGRLDSRKRFRPARVAIGRTYKNHIDGYNLLPYLTREEKENPRKFFMYLSAAQWAETFEDFPPIQKPNIFTLDDALRMIHETAAGMH